MKLLVAAASKHGATSEIAEELGRTFREDGVDADVQAAGQVTSLDDYEAVVLGSAV
jgi:menaquinone-dependent protoporphyrinogen oxidase